MKTSDLIPTTKQMTSVAKDTAMIFSGVAAGNLVNKMVAKDGPVIPAITLAGGILAAAKGKGIVKSLGMGASLFGAMYFADKGVERLVSSPEVVEGLRGLGLPESVTDIIRDAVPRLGQPSFNEYDYPSEQPAIGAVAPQGGMLVSDDWLED